MNRHHQILTGFMLLLLINPSIGLSNPGCESPIAKIIELEGSVEVKHPVSGQWRSAVTNTNLCKTQAIRTKAQSKAILLLINDQTKIVINEYSSVHFATPETKSSGLLSQFFTLFSSQSRTSGNQSTRNSGSTILGLSDY